jgi:uncharacterized membrane protein
MSQVHLHLLITHLPVFGSILGALVLGYGLWSKSSVTKNAAYFLFIISAIGAGVAYLTGEGAEEAVEEIAGVSESIIKVHENAALYALVSLVALGIFSLGALIINYKKTAFIKPIAIMTLAISLVSFGLVAWTGYLGGQIRHTEISKGMIQQNGGQESDDDD